MRNHLREYLLVAVLVTGAVARAEADDVDVDGSARWQSYDRWVLTDDASDAEVVPTTPGLVVPAPDGAIAGISLLAGLGIGYWLRHHRARRQSI